MNNPLTDIIPAAARKYVYATFFLAGLVLGALQIAHVDTGAAGDVLAYIGAALGLTAASNIHRQSPKKLPYHEGN